MIGGIAGKLVHLVEDNSTTILTGIGVAGTVTTAVLTGRATFKAAYIIHKESLQRTPGDEPVGSDFAGLPDLTTSEKIKLVWPQYIPAVGVGALTIGAIVYSNRLSAKETAAMAAAYSMSDKTFQEYKEKVQEKLGQKREEAIRDEVAQERINRNPPGERTIIITGGGDVLCYDVVTDRYFNSTVENIKKAENLVNGEIVSYDAVPLSRFYDAIGLRPTPYTEEIGWNLDNRCEVQFSTVLSPDQRPCISIDFARYPKPNFDTSHNYL